MVFVVFLSSVLSPFLFSTIANGNTCDDPVVINLSFEYEKNYGFLPGVAEDVRSLKSLYGTGKGVHHLHLRSAAQRGGKAALLAHLRKLIGNRENVIFNYNGHGFTRATMEPPKSRAEMVKMVKERKKAETSRSGTQSAESKQLEDELEPIDINVSPAPPSGGFLMATPECMRCRFSATSLTKCQARCRAHNTGLDPDMHATYTTLCSSETCENPTTNPELDSCYRNHCISMDELSEVFKGKKVSGMIDACHSGGLALKGVEYSFAVSAFEFSKAKDSPQGGVLTRTAMKMCEDGRLNGKTGVSDVATQVRTARGFDTSFVVSSKGPTANDCFVSSAVNCSQANRIQPARPSRSAR